MGGLFYLRLALALWVIWVASWFLAMLWQAKATSEAPRGTWRW